MHFGKGFYPGGVFVPSVEGQGCILVIVLTPRCICLSHGGPGMHFGHDIYPYGAFVPRVARHGCILVMVFYVHVYILFIIFTLSVHLFPAWHLPPRGIRSLCGKQCMHFDHGGAWCGVIVMRCLASRTPTKHPMLSTFYYHVTSTLRGVHTA